MRPERVILDSRFFDITNFFWKIYISQSSWSATSFYCISSAGETYSRVTYWFIHQILTDYRLTILTVYMLNICLCFHRIDPDKKLPFEQNHLLDISYLYMIRFQPEYFGSGMWVDARSYVLQELHLFLIVTEFPLDLKINRKDLFPNVKLHRSDDEENERNLITPEEQQFKEIIL